MHDHTEGSKKIARNRDKEKKTTDPQRRQYS